MHSGEDEVIDFTEILDRYSLKEIGKKTRISIENLECLINGDWEKLRKVQAMGFISIIEREYGADLSDLKKECEDYWSTHQIVETVRSYEIPSSSPSESGGFVKALVKILMMIVLVGAVAASWYFFVDERGMESGSDGTTTQKASYYESIMNVASDLFGGSEDTALDTAPSDEEKILTEGAWAEEEKNDSVKKDEEEELKTPSESNGSAQEKESSEKRADEDTQSISDSAIIEKIKKQESEGDDKRSPEESNGSEIMTISDLLPYQTMKKREESREKNESREESKESNIDDELALSVEIPSLSEEMERNGVSSPVIKKPSDEDSRKSTKSAKPASKEKKAEKRKGDKTSPKSADNQKRKSLDKKGESGASRKVVFIPGRKIWIGYRELESGKRFAETTDKKVVFDTAKKSYILATGHGVIEFDTASGKVKLNDGKRHFFKIAGGKVNEISHERFQKLNNSKVW